MMILTNCFSLGLLFLGVIHQEIMLLYIGSFMFGSIYSVGAVGIPMLTHYFFGNENYARTYSFIGFLTNVGSASSLTLIDIYMILHRVIKWFLSLLYVFI